MSVTSYPIIDAQLLAATGMTQVDPWRVLFCGQIGSDGTAVSGTAYSDIDAMTTTQIKTLFGTKGDMTNRILRHMSVTQGRTSVWAIGLTGSGTAASFTVTCAGTATSSGTITIKAIDSYNWTTTLAVANGTSAATLASNIKTAIDAFGAPFPATSGVVGGSAFTLTANDVGTLGNKYTMEFDNVPSGLTVTSGQFSSGATDPTLTNIFANVSETRFHRISWPWHGSTTVAQSFLEARNVVNNNFLHGIAFMGIDDTEANLKTLVDNTTPLNSYNLLFMGNRQASSSSFIITPPDWRVAEFLGIEALRMTSGSAVGQYVTTSAPADQFGGPAMASLPYFNTVLALTDIHKPEDLFSGTEQSQLLGYGFTTMGVNSSNTATIMGETVTTYKFNSIGQADVSFKYLNYVTTGFLALELFFKTLKSTYSQSRLTNGDVVPNRAMTNKDGIIATCMSIYKTLSGGDYCLTQAGGDAEKYFYSNLAPNTAVDVPNGVVTLSGALPIVTQLRKINIAFRLSFTIGG